MITSLDFDSNFFGYPVGKIEVLKQTLENLPDSAAFKLIYIFSSTPLNLSLPIVDVKIEYEKSLTSNQVVTNKNIKIFNSKLYNQSELNELALLSGKYSRFKNDPNFVNNEFVILYLKWLENSLANKDSEVYIYLEANKIVGFVSLDFYDGFSRIGLIAVHENYQGKGIASQLINYCEWQSLKSNKKTIKVATQGENQAANYLYTKKGFNIKSKTYIYHKWNP